MPGEMSLSHLFYDLVHNAPNGVTTAQLAARIGKPRQVLLNEVAPGSAGHKLGVGTAHLVLDGTDGWPRLARYSSRLADGAFVDLSKIKPELASGDMAQVMAQAMAATKEFGDVAGRLSEVMALGEATVRNRKALTHEIYEAVEALLVLDAMLTAMEVDEG